jgi:septum formation protein
MIYLASRSPRRQELLRQIGVTFDELRLREAPGRPLDVVERARKDEPAADYVQRIALAKSKVGARCMRARALPEKPVLGADTEVVLDGIVFGKPVDEQDAIRMITLLSGRTHIVLCAIALSWHRKEFVALSTTKVVFRKLTNAEIERYVALGESLDKAGAYAVQGRAAAFIRRIDGSYSGVMGLPLCETAQALTRIGVPVL